VPPQLHPKGKSERRKGSLNPVASSVLGHLISRNTKSGPDRDPVSNRISPFNILQVDERRDSQSVISQCKWQKALLIPGAVTVKIARLLQHPPSRI
jgi:hypothetical protein